MRLKHIKDADKYIKLERFVFDMDKMYKVSDLLGIKDNIVLHYVIIWQRYE